MTNSLAILFKRFPVLYNRTTSLILFVIFALLNAVYFINNFFLFFLNKNDNADEYYHHNVYSLANLSLEKIFCSPSQPFIFIASLFNVVVNDPKIATRLVSLVFSSLLIIFLIRKSNKDKTERIEQVFKTTLFLCAIYITNQHYIGTSDFLSYFFIVIAMYLMLKAEEWRNLQYSNKKAILIGLLFALTIATRPTALILIACFYAALAIIIGVKAIFSKSNIIIVASTVFFILLINAYPLTHQNTLVFDVKEIPKETGVTWFQRNYLMAKNWDSHKTPNTKWVSIQEVIDFKKENPTFVFPKNQLELAIREPAMYARQMVRMSFKALYSSFRFMCFLFPLLFLAFFIHKTRFSTVNKAIVDQSKVMVLFHGISIIVFSFIAVKLFEFRWVIPILILYVFYALKFLSYFPKNIRNFIYNLCFLCGIVLYTYFYYKEGISLFNA
jgi:hypothetical protein